MKMTAKILAMLTTTALASTAFAGDITINYDEPGGALKQGLENVVAAFEAEYPDINVTVNFNDREAHKTAIRNFLSADAPEITSWYPGNRMAPFVDAGQFEDLSELWATDENLSQNFEAVKSTMTRDGKQWGVPFTYYQWGIYFRADIFEQYGIEKPATWSELLSACDTLKENGVTPFTIGTKDLWATAGVFDYLNLRTNGYEVHNALTAGEIKYSDDRIKQTFANWQEMLDRCSFVENHATMNWQDAIAPFAKGEAAMYVMGNFAVDAMKEAGLSVDQIDYFPFPEITPGIARAEEAPADAFFMPANAKNKEDAYKFLAFISRPDVQAEWNKTIGQLPANSQAGIDENDKFAVQGQETLSTASGLSQFFDRDAPAEMAKVGMEGFQEFMIKPERLDDIIKRLDSAQERIYK